MIIPPTVPAELVAATINGIGILDNETSYTALTHNRDQAIAALRVFHRTVTAGTFAHPFDTTDLTTGWVRFEPRPDGTWAVPCPAGTPGAVPATVLHH